MGIVVCMKLSVAVGRNTHTVFRSLAGQYHSMSLVFGGKYTPVDLLELD